MSFERRKAPRFPREGKVVVRPAEGGPVSALAVNISSCGLLVHLDRAIPLRPGDAVTVEVELPADAPDAFSAWGVGRVVWLEGNESAIELRGGSFLDPESEPGEAS